VKDVDLLLAATIASGRMNRAGSVLMFLVVFGIGLFPVVS
jgi:hypothetical protein